MKERKLGWDDDVKELNTGTVKSNNDPRKQVVYLRTEKNHLTVLLRDKDKEIAKLRAALEEIASKGSYKGTYYERLTYFRKLAKEALK